MERSTRLKEWRDAPQPTSNYDLELQLENAERRYDEARTLAAQAREDLRALISQPGAAASAVLAARARLDAIVARCARLHRLIDELEERLDS